MQNVSTAGRGSSTRDDRRRNTSALAVSVALLIVSLVPFVLSLMVPGLVSGSHELWVTPVAWGSLVALAGIAVVMSARGGRSPECAEDHLLHEHLQEGRS